jgi:hypothetical protein
MRSTIAHRKYLDGNLAIGEVRRIGKTTKAVWSLIDDDKRRNPPVFH